MLLHITAIFIIVIFNMVIDVIIIITIISINIITLFSHYGLFWLFFHDYYYCYHYHNSHRSSFCNFTTRSHFRASCHAFYWCSPAANLYYWENVMERGWQIVDILKFHCLFHAMTAFAYLSYSSYMCLEDCIIRFSYTLHGGEASGHPTFDYSSKHSF